MTRTFRSWLTVPVVVLAMLAAACGGDPATEVGGSEPAAGGSEAAAAIDTTCQVELPAEGEGSAVGMADDPVATAASNNPALSTLVAAVTEAGLVDTLNDTSMQFTIFAPTNEAFAKIPKKDLQKVLKDKELLTSILTLHVVPEQQLDANALVSAGAVPTVNGAEVPLAAEGSSLTVNGQASVICPNVMTANATVHLIDTVLMPSS